MSVPILVKIDQEMRP